MEGANADVQLLARLRAGDEAAFSAVVREWSPVMLRVAGSFVASRASAEECVQEAWLGVIRGLEGFEGRSQLRTWTLTIVANIARRRGRRDGRMVLGAFADGDDGPAVDPRRFRPAGEQWAGGWTAQGAPRAWEPESMLLAGETLAVLLAGLRDLPPRQRAVVALRDVHGLSAEEVCAVLEVSAGNQRLLLHRGRARLRQQLEDYHRAEVAL